MELAAAPWFYSLQELPLKLATLRQSQPNLNHSDTNIWEKHKLAVTPSGGRQVNTPAGGSWREGLACSNLTYRVVQNPGRPPWYLAASLQSWAWLFQAAAVESGRGSAFPRQWLQSVCIAERRCRYLPSATTCPGEMQLQTQTLGLQQNRHTQTAAPRFLHIQPKLNLLLGEGALIAELWSKYFYELYSLSHTAPNSPTRIS